MIPGDLAARLRTMLEASVQPLSVVHEIPGNLPRFETGERFTAQIQNPLPDGSFRALVAGKTITLALPDSAKSGDVMELVVSGRQGSAIIARQTGEAPQPALNTGDTPRPVLSQTGQLISQLLTGRFGEPEPVPLARGVSLLPEAPAKAAELAPLLKQAISNSGLFYESHLRQWVEGKLPLSALQQEPQAQQAPLPDPSAPRPDNRVQQASPQPLPEEAGAKPLSKASTEAAIPAAQTKPATTDEAAEAPPARPAQLEAFAEQAGKSTTARNVAEPLMPVVQQQLEALATHQMSWQGQVWPGMQMQWDIIDPEQQSKPGAGDEESMRFWRSALRLQLPHMGDIQAQLVLGPQGLSVLIDTNSDASAQRMRAAQTELLNALEAAGVSVINMQVSEHASV
ncbi:flagellar hook-length control protein FliK [Uliginosibacterium sp. 31-16]|uniref:flagellar hook-length control protein FliK n=1 Tax=Uliginosibacterium sp. 31-16 TaxID=3068315 RepID=UPI00273D0734|nr:flagellar hook-length control protein FliK [Uliginosibacterium sp. 31-16]MDP5240681.1 flagellar hook-length control protein FliK [Uliginosibacterium sp. 31-16]